MTAAQWDAIHEAARKLAQLTSPHMRMESGMGPQWLRFVDLHARAIKEVWG